MTDCRAGASGAATPRELVGTAPPTAARTPHRIWDMHRSPVRRAVLALLAATIAAAVPGAAHVRAASSSDIPGVPLPGPVSTGQLGGPIYDVVYNLSVSPGSIIIASLSGQAGTDFDMYLFDSTATTVLSTTGLLKDSLNPGTSTESISWPTPTGGTFYIDLNGSTDVQGSYRLVVQVVPDRTPPVVSSVTLDGGKAATNDATVSVAVRGADDLSGVADVALSNDGHTWGPWEPYGLNVSWSIPVTQGRHTVWAKVRNGVGLESAPLSSSILLDTIPPTVIAIDPAPGADVASVQPRITVRFSEPIDPDTWTSSGLLVQAADGTLVPGDATWDDANLRGSWVPRSPLDAGRAYAVTLGNVTDVAGNPVAPVGSWTIVPLLRPGFSVVAAPSTIVPGGRASLDVTLVGVPTPATVTLLEQPAGAPAFTQVASHGTSSGHVSFDVQPAQNTVYRVSYLGAFGVSAASADVRVLVRRSIALSPAGPTTRTVSKGTRVALTARVSQAAGAKVSFQLYRLDRSSGTYRYAGSFGRTVSVDGTARLTWTASTAGRFYWRAIVASDASYANNTSATSRWLVTG